MAEMIFTAAIRDRVHDVRIERREGLYVVTIDGVERVVDAHKLDSDFYSILIAGRSFEVSVERDRDRYFVRHGAAEEIVTLADPSRAGRDAMFSARSGPETILSIMPGRVVRLLVQEGDEVRASQGLLVVEAMKMENEIASPRAGRVASIEVRPGQTVETGAKLMVLE